MIIIYRNFEIEFNINTYFILFSQSQVENLSKNHHLYTIEVVDIEDV